MNRKFFIISVFLVVFLTHVVPQEASINELKDIVIKDNIVEIVCSFKPTFQKIFLDNPPRVVVDISNCVSKIEKKEIDAQTQYIKGIRIGQKTDKTLRVVLDLKSKQDCDVYPEDNSIKILVKKTQKQIVEKQQKGKFKLPKTLVSLECVDADIQEVFQMLAVKSKINIIYGPDVTGKITISLKNVPFDKAFENILAITKLTYVPVSENIIRVATPQTIEQERTLNVVYTKIFPLNYAVASDVKTQLDAIRQAEGRTKGTIVVDNRTNSLIVTETEEGLNYIEELIKKLDRKPYQVSIEAQIIDISVDDLKDLGIQWGVGGFEREKAATSDLGFKFDKKYQDDTVNILTPQQTERPAKMAQVGDVATTLFPQDVTPFITFTFGKFTETMGISGYAAIAALVSQGKAKVLSNPRVTTLNNKTAVILAGEKIPYKTSRTQTTTGAGGISTTQETWEYITAGIQLTVTPTVSPDGWITLTVKPQVDIPQVSAVGAPPTVKSRQTEVTVLLKDNEPLIIGGLITDQDIELIRKVPLLGDLPILGYLFKYKGTTKKRTELIIMITPRIIES